MRRKDIFIIAAVLFLLLGLAAVGWWLVGIVLPILTFAFGVVTVPILALMFEVRRRQQVQLEEARRLHQKQAIRSERHYEKIEALFSLFFTLQPRKPLPAMGRWAAAPDLLRLISETIHREKPSLIVEASSGVSTLICAYNLQLLGSGRIIALEHDRTYAASTRQLIESHGLQDVVTVVHAPLRTATINGEEWLWYDTNCLSDCAEIDLLVIDGPPYNTQEFARYPALPLLYEKLRDGAFVILDDGARKDEKKIAQRWSKEFPRAKVDYIELAKGAWVLQKME